MWVRCFQDAQQHAPDGPGDDDDDDDEARHSVAKRAPTEYVQALAKQAHSLHEIKIKDSTLFVDPPLEAARAKWMQQMGVALAVVSELSRLKRTEYSELSDDGENESGSYEHLIAKLPVRVLKEAYDVIWLNVSACEKYVGSWMSYQALWDLDSSAAVSRLGTDVRQWLDVLAQLRQSRVVFDTVETQKSFGPITVDFSKVQHGVTVKYDAWHRELLGAFARMLGEGAVVLLGELRSAREKLEQNVAEKGTGDAVTFLTLMQELKGVIAVWQGKIETLADGEKALVKNRFRLASDWVHAANVEGEWMAFQQIYKKRDIALAEEIPGLQAKVIEEDRASQERVKQLLLDWGANKPLSGGLTPASAIDALSVFEARVKVLHEVSTARVPQNLHWRARLMCCMCSKQIRRTVVNGCMHACRD